MFDLFLQLDLKQEGRKTDKIKSFFNLPYYDNVKGTEYSVDLVNFVAKFLEREETNKNYYQNKDTHFFIYGTIYTNNKYKELNNINPKVLTAKELYELYKKYKTNLVKYTKGSFQIIIFDQKKNKIILISDRLNVLPLYYSFKNNMFTLSSSIRMILKYGQISHKLNQVALTEQMIFDYLIGTKTFYKDIKQTSPGTIYNISNNSIKTNKFWDVKDLYHSNLLGKRESLELLSEQLYENVNLYGSDNKKLLVSFTGGFDGRTNVAMLNKRPENFLCYSYGMPGSKQINIPEKCCKELNLNYKPILLNNHFKNNYTRNALEAVEFSNGMAPIIRANYTYAHKKLRSYSNTTITGLFGSEILRPLHNTGIIINDHSERLFLDGKVEDSISKSINELKQLKYISPQIMEKSKDFIINEFRENYFDNYRNFDKVTRFFFFIIKEGIRKYFMQEIQSERPYVTNRFPYFDDDLVQLMYKTPFAGMYNGFLGKSKFKRRKGQLLYAHILNKYEPKLGNMVLDRGYAPNDLLKPFPLNYLFIAKGVWKARKYLEKYGNDTFDVSGRWERPTVDMILTESNNIDYFDINGLGEAFKTDKYRLNRLKFYHIISLLHYLGK